MSLKMKSSAQGASQDGSDPQGSRASPPQSSSNRRFSALLSSTGSESTYSGQLPGTPHCLAPSMCFTPLDDKAGQNRDPAHNNDRPSTYRGRTMSQSNSLHEGRTGWDEDNAGPSSFLPPMGKLQPRSGSSAKPRSLRSFSTSSASVSAEAVLSLPLSVTKRRRSSVGGGGAESREEQLDTQQPSFFNLGEFNNPARSDSDSPDNSQSESSNAPLGPSPTRSLSAESIGSSNSVPFEPPPPPPPSLWKQFTGNFSNRVIKRHLKFMLALYLSSALTLIRPVALYLGPTPFLANITVVFMHPARTVGSQLEVTVFSVIGALLATVSILPCQLAIVAYNQKYRAEGDSAAWAIEAIWFFFGIWIMTTWKARYAKLSWTFLIFTIANIFAHSTMHTIMSFDIHNYLTLIGPIMAGVGICLFVNIFCWPETASEGLGRALNESLDTSRTLLNLSTRSFLLHHKTIALPKSVLENAQDEVRKAQKELYSAYREARYEVTFSKTDPADYKEVRVVVSALMRHLGSMSLVVQNERLLMLGHPDRDDDDLLSGETPESEDSGSDTDDRQKKVDKGKAVVRPDAQSLKYETHLPLHRRRSSRSIDGLNRTPEVGKHRRKRGGAEEVRRVRQLLLRAENSTEFMLKARQSQQEKSKNLTRSNDDSQKDPSQSSRPAEKSKLDQPEPGLEKQRSDTGRSHLSVTASPRQSLEGNSGKLDGDRAHPLGSEKISSSGPPFPSRDDDSNSVGSDLMEIEVRKAAENFKEKKRRQKKILAKKEEEDAVARAMPPKEVAFGDRRLFLSFLDTVREPLQRLSDSCSRVIVSMEKEIVVGLNVEQDRLERIRRRNAQREAIVRRADQNSRRPTNPTDTAAIASAGSEATTNLNPLSGPNSTDEPLSWERVKMLMKVKQRMLTQEELDYAEAIREARGNSDRGRKLKVFENKDESANSLQQGLRRRLSWIVGRQGPVEDDDQFSIPENVSSVQYLTNELEIFDAAEAEGVRGFIASHPTLDVGPREEIFLIFFFIFALREIARELLHLGMHIEKLQERQQQQMEKEGRERLRRKLWWPKVVGNFWLWFSWGSYSQARSTEGYAGLVMNSSKNLERSETRLVEDERARVEAKAAKAAAAKAKKEEHALLAETSAKQAPFFSRPRRSLTISALHQARRDPIDLEHGLEPQEQIQSGRVVIKPLPTSKRRRSKTLMPQHTHQASSSVLSDHNISGARSLVQDKDHQNSNRNTGNIKDRRFTVVDIAEYGATGQKKKACPSNTAAEKSVLQPRDSMAPFPRLPVKDDVDDQDDSESDSAFDGDRPLSSRSHGALNSDRYHSINLSEKKPLAEKQLPRSTQRQVTLGAPPTRALVFSTTKPKTIRYRIWEALQPFKSDEVKYGFKMALALTFIGLWAWLGWNIAVLATDRGQWAMMTVMAVLSPTIGATFRVCAIRIAGTIVGVVWAMLTYLAYPYNPYVICAMMVVITFAVAFLVLQSKQPVMGVIMMLSYSSITFGTYHGTNDTIFEISYKRTITVTLGILISVVLNTFLWPVLARRELRKEIALLIGRQGVFFAELVNKFLLEEPEHRIPSKTTKAQSVSKRDVLDEKQGLTPAVLGTAGDKNVFAVESVECTPAQGSQLGTQSRNESNAEPPLITTGSARMVPKEQPIPSQSPLNDEGSQKSNEESNQIEKDQHAQDPDQLAFQHVEHQLQTKIIKIRELLELSASEPRLKEEFPIKLYNQIVQCCQNILDRMISMRMAAQLLSPEVRELVTGPMNYYRRDMVGALLLYFSVLSSSLASKTPLPPYLPSARIARLRVIYNVSQAITAHQAKFGEDHYTYIYYYAFSSALEEVIEELELLAILIKPLVGITFLSSKDRYVGGVQGDQLSLRSAIGSAQIGIEPSEPTLDRRTAGLASPDPTFGIKSKASSLGLGHGSTHGFNIGPLDNLPLSSQDVTQQQLMEQQLNIQNQQQGYQQQHRLAPNVGYDLAPEHPTSEQSGSPLPTQLVDKRLDGLRIVIDPFDPLHGGSLARSPVSATSNVVSPALVAVGSPTGPILTSPLTASPIPIMDERLLGSRRAQRFKDALQLAQEASGEEVFVLPSPLLEVPSTPGKEGAGPALGVPQDPNPVAGSVLSPTLSFKRLIQKLVPSSPLREQAPLSIPTEAPIGIFVYPPLADDTDDEKNKEKE